MKLLVIIFFSLIVFGLSGSVMAQDDLQVTVDQRENTVVYQQQTSERLTVQKILDFPELTLKDRDAIERYLDKHPGLKGVNYAATKAALQKLRALKVIHLPLTEAPKEYLKEIQIIEQMLKYLRLYVNVPAPEQRPLPEFQRTASCGPLELVPVPNVCLPAPCKPVQVCKPAPCGGATSFGRGERSSEVPIGYLSRSWGRSNTRTEVETCPPGTAPTPPSPNSDQVLTPGNPSGSIPDPPAGNVNQPPSAGGHGTGGNTYDPSPSHVNVADPVK